MQEQRSCSTDDAKDEHELHIYRPPEPLNVIVLFNKVCDEPPANPLLEGPFKGAYLAVEDLENVKHENG